MFKIKVYVSKEFIFFNYEDSNIILCGISLFLFILLDKYFLGCLIAYNKNKRETGQKHSEYLTVTLAKQQSSPVVYSYQ